MTERPARVGVAGGGTMGAGIAITAVRAGLPTCIYEVDGDRADAARERVRAFLDGSAKRGKLSEEQRDAALDHLDTTTDLAAFGDRDVVIEAVPEDLELKQELFGRLDDIVAPSALLATNTSTLSVSQIAAGSRLPERVVGMHFCNPAPLMPLIEVVRGILSGDEAVARARELTAALGKEEVVVSDTPGFVVNRFLVPFENDCIRALERGVGSVKDIDRSVRFGLGYPMGPFTLLDTVGLDVHRAVSMSLYTQLRDPRFAPPPLVDKMIAANYLGRKSGRGFYEYEQPGMFGA